MPFVLSIIFFLNSFSFQTNLHLQADAALKDCEIIQLQLNPKSLRKSILENAIIYYTNKARTNHNLQPCKHSSRLQDVARLHSQEMDSLQYFSHISPVSENHELRQRIENNHINVINRRMGENIGVDYYLAIANIPFYIKKKKGRKIYVDTKTKTEISYQTYIEFARNVVEKWMASPGHRENILIPEYNEIGIGIASGIFKDIEAIYVTQLFMGPISIQQPQ